jgi:GNAT superfamily N-acetyltransferase
VTSSIREAGDADLDAVVTLVNRAYEVENFFVTGDRISRAALEADLRSGTMFVLEAAGQIAASVYVSVAGSRGYFGLLAVDPARQGRGFGQQLIRFAEGYAAARGAGIMAISVVNVRTDLLPFYERLGYRVTGTAPYVNRPVTQPVHFVLMEKALV